MIYAISYNVELLARSVNIKVIRGVSEKYVDMSDRKFPLGVELELFCLFPLRDVFSLNCAF